ncbi:hypothetical protein BCV72DRAFT_96129, partial [Rhizopus microsporus var. microsporus]
MGDIPATAKKQKNITINIQMNKSIFFYILYFNKVKLFNAAKSGRLAGGISERTVQKWTKRLKKVKDWNILEKQTNLINRTKPQLGDMHKFHLNFYDEYP